MVAAVATTGGLSVIDGVSDAAIPGMTEPTVAAIVIAASHSKHMFQN
ncbi:hypothetical protein LBMAG07_03010 [Actinomycetes bacterium]|nr:hypothetical protein LBMAG07_03010 [Actinomycetes bacterium]